MKKSQYYLKDKKAQIYKKKDIAEAGDMPREVYIPISSSSLWCYAAQLSQDRIYQAKGVGVDEYRFFVFNHLKNVDVNDALLYRGKWYNITRVDTQDDYNTDTFIYVNDMSIHETPDEDEIIDYETGAQYL